MWVNTNKPFNQGMNKTFWCFLLMALMMVSFSVQAASVTAKADRGVVAMNESFQLTFEASGSVNDDRRLNFTLDATFNWNRGF